MGPEVCSLREGVGVGRDEEGEGTRRVPREVCSGRCGEMGTGGSGAVTKCDLVGEAGGEWLEFGKGGVV